MNSRPKGSFELLTKISVARARIILQCEKKKNARQTLQTTDYLSQFAEVEQVHNFLIQLTHSIMFQKFLSWDSFQPFLGHKNVIHNYRFFICLLSKARQSLPKAFRLPDKLEKENKCLTIETYKVAVRGSQGADS